MSSDHPTGSVLDGKYEVLSHLGGGGMGEVYLVRHVHLEEKRVVKILRPDRVQDPDAQKRFQREGRFATQIKHPHVAILYDYSRLEDGSFYMVWEYIEGEDVGTRVRREGPFPVPVAIDLGIQALRGLEAIHGAGMIHRDVSPDNLMISAPGDGAPGGRGLHLKIIDLGLAKNLEHDPELELTQDGMFMGKLLYCAPEQAGLHKGETVDHRTDLYSLGLVLYEMLTGLPAFEADNPQGAIFKRLSQDPLPLVDRNPDQPVPPYLERVVVRALAREREDRFPDARSFIEALERSAARLERAAAGGEPPPPPGPPPGRPRQPEGSKELSRAEKEDLLAQIEAAAIRRSGGRGMGGKGDGTTAPQGAQKAEERQRRLEEMRDQRRSEVESAVETARERIGDGDAKGARVALERARELTASSGEPETEPGGRPELPEIERIAAEVEELEEAAVRQGRIDEAAAMVETYVKNRQVALARLALDTLIELTPVHPKRSDYESWIELVAEELDEEKRAVQVLEAGREALARNDFRAARRSLGQLRKADADMADAFESEIEVAEEEEEKSADFEEHLERLERLIGEGELAEAQKELETLAELGAARVTLELWRSRLDEARTAARDTAQTELYLESFRERLEQEDYSGARSVAGELQRISPGDPRAADLFAEVARLEREAEHRRALEQGEQQVERLIGEGNAAKAELALSVLLRLDPDNRKRKSFEKRIARLGS